MENIIIRKIELKDIEQVAKIKVIGWQTAYKGIINQDYLDSLNIEEQTKKFAQSICDTFIVAEQGSEILGFCRYVFDNSFSPNLNDIDCELTAIYVKHNKKGLGIGTKLFNYVTNEFSKKSKKRMILWCLKDNTNSIAFYKKMGGKIVTNRIVEIDNKNYDEVGILYNI